jgi:hypothetical protein
MTRRKGQEQLLVQTSGGRNADRDCSSLGGPCALLLIAATHSAEAVEPDLRTLTTVYMSFGQALYPELARPPGNIVF